MSLNDIEDPHERILSLNNELEMTLKGIVSLSSFSYSEKLDVVSTILARSEINKIKDDLSIE